MNDYPVAVELRNVDKSYGRGRGKLHVLSDLNLTVPQGAIYGLLGPSGCGKTTLLKCVLGQLKPEKGTVMSLGRTPGNRKYGIPGRLVGYMPQDIALFNEFTIGETLSFYGRIHGMSKQHIRQRTCFLIDFLTLPEKGRLISKLSGGQKRRVSLAAALLQQPVLLILDEPTVGVDPVLREKIWSHLLEIAKDQNQKTTIIITTHYIEEARQADRVGLMRNGRILAENSPTALLDKYNMKSLETLFLHLCKKDSVMNDEEDLEARSVDIPALPHNHVDISQTDTPSDYKTLPYSEQIPDGVGIVFSDDMKIPVTKDSACDILRCRNIIALMIKNFIVMKRKVGFLMFQFLLPAIQIILFCLCIGGDPYGLKVNIVNQDQGALGNTFISYLDNTTMSKVPYSNFTDAIDSVRNIKAWGVIYVDKNFTADTFKKFLQGTNVTNATLEGSSVKLYLDMTNQQISLALQQKISDGFSAFYTDLLKSAGQNPGLASLPVRVEDPVYGTKNPSFTNFMAPGIILSITFFMATGLTALSFVLERSEGLLDRSSTAGVSFHEIMLSHVMTQFFVMVIQVGLLLVFALAVFKIPYEGSLIWVILLVLLDGFCGMALGMLISVLSEKEHEAIQLALGSVFINLLLSGIIWPIEAVPNWLQYICIALPMTLAAEAERSVLGRGRSIEELTVWRGYLVVIGWSVGLLLLSAVILKIKH